MGKAEALRTTLSRVADALLAVTVDPRCAVCALTLDHPARGPVCAACWSLVRAVRDPLCRTCGDPLPSWRIISAQLERCPACRRRPGAIDMARTAGEYEGALREIVHAFKYDGRRSLAAPLARMVRDVADPVLDSASCVVPVPLHPWRRLRRGFNQASDLARRLDVPVVHALWRLRATAPQSGLTAAARRRNLRGAFAVAPWLSRRVRESALTDRIVVLVDDVRTTGATLHACAEVLKDAGVREVRALTVARAPLRQRS